MRADRGGPARGWTDGQTGGWGAGRADWWTSGQTRMVADGFPKDKTPKLTR